MVSGHSLPQINLSVQGGTQGGSHKFSECRRRTAALMSDMKHFITFKRDFPHNNLSKKAIHSKFKKKSEAKANHNTAISHLPQQPSTFPTTREANIDAVGPVVVEYLLAFSVLRNWPFNSTVQLPLITLGFYDEGVFVRIYRLSQGGLYGANYVQFWFRRFRSGFFDGKDAPRTGRPVVENVDKITEIIEVDRHLAIDQERPDLANRRGVVFHQDNTRPHTSVVTPQKRWELYLEVLMHPPHCSDLAARDYPLFLT
ncbi:HTH_48 domain-containing protein [Trichonephila clavipes]|nr:HTH_48 domain-containing protein [Trichonephila clavipes]